MKKLNKKGFTLVEIIAAITVMGVLSGTAVAGVTNSLNKSHNEYCTSQADMMTLAGRDYFNDNASKLPTEIGARTQIDLNTLINSKYIDPLKDYDSTLCNTTNSKVNVIKATQSDYYYSTILDCNKCNSTDTGTSLKESTPSIVFSPNESSTENKDVTVTMNMTDTENEIVSYRYEVYEKVAGKEDTMVSSIKQTLYKGEKITVKLNKKGTYYIKGYAINTYGNMGYKKSKDYVLNYKLYCESQVTVKGTIGDKEANEGTWYNQNITVKFGRKGAVEAYDVSMSYNGGPYQSLVTNRGTSFSTSITETGTYRFKIKAYDDQGSTCEKETGLYKIDKVLPECKTTTTNPNWTNKLVTIYGTCSYDAHSGCNPDKNTHADFDKEINDLRTPGIVQDNAGNQRTCPSVAVRIDLTKPTCHITPVGTTGTGNYYKSAVTGNMTVSDAGGSNVKTKGMSTSSTVDYNNLTSLTYSNNTNTNTQIHGFVIDNAGNTGKCDTPTFRVDRNPPTCALYSSGTAGTNGWYRSNVNIAFNSGATGDVGSGMASTSISDGAILTSDTRSKKFTGTVTDKAGNVTQCFITVKKDTVQPSCPITVSSGTMGSNGWYRSNVTLSLSSASDATSGVSSRSITDGGSLTYDTAGKSFTGTVVDAAGNKRTCSTTIKRDATNPSCSLSVSGTKGTNNWYVSNVTISFASKSDNLSGISTATVSNSGKITSDTGGKIITGTVIDNAGNSGTCKTGTIKRDATPPAAPYMDRSYTETLKNSKGEAKTVKRNVYGNDQSTGGGNANSADLQAAGKTCFTNYTCNSTSTSYNSTRRCAFNKMYACGGKKIQSNDAYGKPTITSSAVTTRGKNTHDDLGSQYPYYYDIEDQTWTATDLAGNTSKTVISTLNTHIWIGARKPLDYYKVSDSYKWVSK